MSNASTPLFSSHSRLFASEFSLALPVAAEEKTLDASGISLNLCELELIPLFSIFFTSHCFPFVFSEKYVTKAEFEHLKARYDQLEAFVRRYLPVAPSPPSNMTYYTMGVPPGMSGIVTDPVPSYPSGSSSIVYNPAMMLPPPQSQPIYQQLHPETPQPPQSTASRYTRTDTNVAQSPTRHNFPATLGMVGPSVSPIMSTMPGPLHHRTRITEGMATSPTAVVSMKTSPLSLSSITSPYHPDPQIHSQPKNYRAQTFRLGERLRLGQEDLKNSTDKTQRAVLVLPVAHQRQICLVMGQCLLQHYRCIPTPSHQGSSRRIILRIQLAAHRARRESVLVMQGRN